MAAASAATITYLRDHMRPSALVVVLLLAMAYPFAASREHATPFLGLCALGGLLIARAPRWSCMGTMAVVLVVLVAQSVFVIANQAHDSKSDRDEAVEIATQAFIAGSNPWQQRTQLDARITSGPASILFAVPSVLLTRRIDATSFAFYLLLFAMLAVADIARRNDTFLPIGLFFSSGFLGVQHTLYWGLDELAWAYAALALGWWLLENARPIGAGACLAVAMGSRPSYAFPIFAFLCWCLYSARPRPDWRRLIVGAAIGAVVIALPFLLVVGGDLLVHNPLAITGKKIAGEWPDTNPLFRALNAVAAMLGPGLASVLKTAFALLAIWYATKRLGRAAPAHPFWHMCLAAFLANFLVYPVGVSDDYTIFFAVPALLAVALSPFGFGAIGDSAAVTAPSSDAPPVIARRAGDRPTRTSAAPRRESRRG